jgi:hypothetical protein
MRKGETNRKSENGHRKYININKDKRERGEKREKGNIQRERDK